MILCLKIIDFVNEVLKICERGVGGVKRWTTWKTL
nr:MAG TPA: hypothetical protein [Caudoviricetes sp.]